MKKQTTTTKKTAAKGKAKGRAQSAPKAAAARKAKGTATPAAAPAQAPSRKEQIMGLIGRKKGATLAEIMKATGWQAHSVRGFMSTSAKAGAAIVSSKNDAGERTYQLQAAA